MENPNPVDEPVKSPEPAPVRDPAPEVAPLDEDKKIKDGIEVSET